MLAGGPMSKHLASQLHQFVSNTDARIFTLRNLPEEVIAVLFAKYSRAPRGLRETLATALEEDNFLIQPLPDYDIDFEENYPELVQKTKEFTEKNVLGYGHASVAEQAFLHFGVEDISLLAAKAIEDSRLGCAYTEQSTRYVEFDPRRVVEAPPELPDLHRDLFSELLRYPMTEYQRLFAELLPKVTEKFKDQPKAVIKAKTCDLLRGLLPMGSLTRLGMSPNARALSHMITKLLSSNLSELKAIGAGLKSQGADVLPTLLRYAEPSLYRQTLDERMRQCVPLQTFYYDGQPNHARLVDYDPDIEERVLTAVLFPFVDFAYRETRMMVRRMPVEERERIFDAYLADRSDREQGGRALEAANFYFEVVVDLGAWRDIQRHRISTQQEQPIGCSLGFDIPFEELEEFGLLKAFCDALDQTRDNYERFKRVVDQAGPEQYLVPLASRRRITLQMNLREVCHFVQLRSGRQGHPSYRKIAQEVYRAVALVSPLLAKAIRCDLASYDLAREAPAPKQA